MPLGPADVRRIAELARIAITDTELAAALQQLNGIFTLVEQLQSVDTTGIEPMAHAQEVTLRLRTDEVTEADQRERLQAIAPQAQAGLYLVPRVIE